MDDRRDSFEAQVMPHLDAAYRFARYLGGDSVDAQDVVQEAFLRAYRAFATLRGGDVKSWLFAIVRNCHSSERRQSARRSFVPLPAEGELQPEAVICSAIATVLAVPIGTVMSRLARARAALKAEWLRSSGEQLHAVP
jgi:DNA-directed RNA polymerase specialized sigma24 family protein